MNSPSKRQWLQSPGGGAWLFTIHGLSSKKMASQKEQVLHVTVPCWDLATRKPVGGQASRLMLRTQVKPCTG